MNFIVSLPTKKSKAVRIALLGDIVGKPGIRIVCAAVDWLRSECQIDGIIANAENVADGSGLRCKDYRRLIEAGVDAITLGDHAFRKREIIDTLNEMQDIIRPCNLPASAPGRGATTITLKSGVKVGLITALGRVFMKPVDCPFHAVDQELNAMSPEVTIKLLDFHAEATSDKQLMGRHLDGRITAVLGTHTHVATADEQIFPGGTGFQCDVGMTGAMLSILGRRIEPVLESTLDGIPIPYPVASEDVQIHGTWFDAEPETGKCLQIGRLNCKEILLEAYNHSVAKQRMIL